MSIEPDIVRTLAEIASFHAHVYYDPSSSRPQAESLREKIGERFHVRLGTWHDRKVGPHDRAMFQVSFACELFASFVPWLMLNHAGLSILIHANTNNPKRDHLVDPLWIGTALMLHGEALPDEDDAEDALAPNTKPHLAP